MLTPKQMTLQAGLSEFGLRELPKPWDQNSGDVWITALAMVRKANGLSEYVKVVNDGQGNPAVKKDYGSSAAIVCVERIYPVETLSKRLMPDLRSNKAIYEFLTKNGQDGKTVEHLLTKDGKDTQRLVYDRTEIKRLITQTAIANARAILEEERRCRNIYAPKKSKDEQE